MGSGGWALVAGSWLLAGLLLWPRPLILRPRQATRNRRHVRSPQGVRSDSRD